MPLSKASLKSPKLAITWSNLVPVTPKNVISVAPNSTALKKQSLYQYYLSQD